MRFEILLRFSECENFSGPAINGLQVTNLFSNFQQLMVGPLGYSLDQCSGTTICSSIRRKMLGLLSGTDSLTTTYFNFQQLVIGGITGGC